MASTTAKESIKTATPGFGATLASEWTKLRSIRATYIQVFLAIALSIAVTGLICLAVGATWDELSPQEQADFELTFMTLFGSVFGLVVLIVLGVTAVSSEYSSGMMRLTLTVTPKRARVLAAKLVLVTGISLLVAFVIALGTFVVGQVVLAAYDIETLTLADGEAQETLLGLWLTTPVYVLLAAAFAVMLRSTASAITAILALTFVPSIFGPLLPTWVEENVLRFVVGIAADNLVIPNEDAATYLEPLPAIAVVTAWLVVFIGAAFAMLAKRDV